MSSTNVLTKPTESGLRKAVASDASNVGSILFLVHEDPTLDQRLDTALSIARTCSSHLQLLHVVPIEAYTVADTLGGMIISPEIVEGLEEQAAKLRARIEEKLSREDVSWDYQSTTSVAMAELIGRAALSDLVILGREPKARSFGPNAIGQAGEFMHRCSTPICIPGDDAVSMHVNGKAVIAWNGSLEAANAVRSALGLLKMASEVRVVRFTEPQKGAFPSTKLLEYLSRHGIHAELDQHEAHGDIAANLVTYALTLGASYVLMGGYSHRRAGEFLFGGVTRDLLRACPVSLVMAH